MIRSEELMEKYMAESRRCCDYPRLIRQVREQKGMSQEQLAALAGVERKTVSRTESSRYNSKWQTIRVLLNALGLSVCNGRQCHVCPQTEVLREKNKEKKRQ